MMHAIQLLVVAALVGYGKCQWSGMRVWINWKRLLMEMERAKI